MKEVHFMVSVVAKKEVTVYAETVIGAYEIIEDLAKSGSLFEVSKDNISGAVVEKTAVHSCNQSEEMNMDVCEECSQFCRACEHCIDAKRQIDCKEKNCDQCQWVCIGCGLCYHPEAKIG